jgi:hypothetical protein
LIERFPLMLFTSAGVLVLGLIRWYLGRFHPAAAEASNADAADAAGEDGRLGLLARLTAMFNREPADETVDKAAPSRSRRTHAVERSARSTTSDARRTGKRPASARRAPLADGVDPARERARRRRPTREFDAPESPRRTGLPRDPDLRARPPREVRRDPHARRGRPAASRFDPYEPMEPFDAAAGSPQRRRPAPNGTTATHHPISQVRYRKAAGADEPLDDRPRRPRRPAADSWD